MDADFTLADLLQGRPVYAGEFADTAQEAGDIDRATYWNRLIQDHPGEAQTWAAAMGLASGMSLGQTQGTISSMLRNEFPATYRLGQYSPALYAGHLGAFPLAAALGGNALLQEPALHRFYNDNLRPRRIPPQPF